MKKFFCITLLLMAFSATVALTGCGSKEKRNEIDTARRMGHSQAMELSDGIPLDSIEMEMLLIDVRTRETALRSRGHEKIADAYLESFLSTLDSVNPSLARSLKE